jgi:DNA-directed RNA polymerase specialized sigma24 family protein
MRRPVTHSSIPSPSARMLALLQNLELCSHVGEYDDSLSLEGSPERGDLLDDVIQLKRMIPRLSQPDRTLLNWIGLHHFSEAQVAAWLGITQQAVHKRMHRIATRVAA